MKDFDFLKYKYKFVSFSVILILLGSLITFFIHGGFAQSLDFNGGVRVIVKINDSSDFKAKLESIFKQKNTESQIILLDKNLNSYQIDLSLDSLGNLFGENYSNENLISSLQSVLESEIGKEKLQILSASQIGAVIGNELTSSSFYLLLTTLIILLVYISFRFQFKFAVSASIALIHDLFITIIFIGVFQIKPSIPVIAALLTILGYSINDTIVIFDRIRENMTKSKMDNPDPSLYINNSIFQNLGRTMHTSLATLVAVVAIVIGGATELYDFAYVLIFGVFIGTYSSIFIAAPLLNIYTQIFIDKKN